MNFLRALLGLFFPRNAEAYVERRAEQGEEDLSVYTSVVDLLKALGQDSSYPARARLARQWGRNGYTGSVDDNVWLHAEIMNRVRARSFP